MSAETAPHAVLAALSAPPWPDPPAREAFYGLPGDIVNAVDCVSEADRAAVLAHVLVASACAMGPSPHALVGAERHPARLFAVVVGASAKARKGTAWAPVRLLLELADPEWLSGCTTSGLSSGEGLIEAVRDPVTRTEKGAEVLVDAGVTDKRLLVIEQEFARVLRSTARQGNTLSAVLRMAWDSGELRTLTRSAPQRSTGAHIAIIAHVTGAELARELPAAEQSNGFSNRFLWVAAQRSKLLPDPPAFAGDAVIELGRRLREAVTFGRQQDRLERDDDATALWRAMYPSLSADRGDGLAGEVLARSEAQVLRLSLVFALLDRSPVIRVPHLTAAAAFWDFCERSALHVFGEAVADPLQHRLRDALGARPLTRTEISERLGRHVPASHIDAALGSLAEDGRATVSRLATGGRPVEVWTGLGEHGAK